MFFFGAHMRRTRLYPLNPGVTVSYFLSAKATSLGKEALLVPRCAFFAECYDLDTWQSTSLLSVTLNKVTIIPLFLFVFAILSKQTKDISHNHHIYITDITESSHTSNTRHSSQRSHVSSHTS
jgi:hypothetical protein